LDEGTITRYIASEFASVDVVVASDENFTALDRVMPHPVYGRNHWVCVLNPSDATFHSVRPLLAEAYQIAVDRAGRRKIRADERTRT
jgi:hypothetical protein